MKMKTIKVKAQHYIDASVTKGVAGKFSHGTGGKYLRVGRDTRTNWILEDGFWRDSGIWFDGDEWNDGI